MVVRRVLSYASLSLEARALSDASARDASGFSQNHQQDTDQAYWLQIIVGDNKGGQVTLQRTMDLGIDRQLLIIIEKILICNRAGRKWRNS